MAIYPGEISRLELGGHDLSEFVTGTVGFELDPWQRQMLNRLPTGSITLDFRVSLREHRLYDAWWRAWERAEAYWRESRRQRLSRMHAAYRRRRR